MGGGRIHAQHITAGTSFFEGCQRDNQLREETAARRWVLVPEGGLEPPQGCPYRILSPARLPFHHSGT